MSDELFEGIDDSSIIEAEKEKLRAKYKLTFSSSDMGLEVLSDILVNLCRFGCYLENPDDVSRYNVGVGILSNIGVFKKGNEGQVIKTLVGKIPGSLSPKNKKEG